MNEEFGPDFITVTDEDGNDIELELLDVLEHKGQTYMAFFPAVLEGTEEESDDYGMVILKSIQETERSCSPPWTARRSSPRSTTSSWRPSLRTRSSSPPGFQICPARGAHNCI